MHFNHYGRDAVQLAASLANDVPVDAADLARRYRAAGFVLESPTLTATDYHHTVEFVDQWRAVAATDSPAARAATLNRLLLHHAAAPRLTDHLGDGWHLHFRDDNISAAAQIAALICAATALHLTGRGIDRMGLCALAECDHVYVDTSRNGRQRYCGTTCSNRDAVRRHRQRSAAL